MRKKRKSYIAVTGSIRSEWLRGLSRKICIGALAFSAAVVLLTGGKVGAYASDQTRVSSDESQVTVGYDDLDDTLQKGGLGVVVEQQDGAVHWHLHMMQQHLRSVLLKESRRGRRV